MPNFIWMCTLCRLPVAKNHNFGQILNFGGLLYRLPFTDKAQIWCAKADLSCTLTGRISSECVHCVYIYVLNVIWKRSLCRLPVAKNHKFGQILNFGGGYCSDPLLPIKVKCKCGVLKQTYRVHLQAEFHLNVFIVSPSGGQKPQFWANFDFLGAPVPAPFYR